MEFFSNTNIDFMRYRRICFSVSMVLLIATIGTVFLRDTLNLGIDFVGGTQLTVKFAEAPAIDELRELMESNGIEDALIQRFGEASENSMMIKTPLVEGAEEGSGGQIVEVLRQRYPSASARDLNQLGTQSIASLLTTLDPDQLRARDELLAAQHYEAIANEISELKRTVGLLESWDQIDAAVSPEVAAALRENAVFGSFAVLGAENVGPQIGAELRESSLWAMVWALLGMLVYIWLRFELRFGVGALVAVSHDVFITLGLFAVSGYEFNLTTIAGFLTLVGYSVNDSVVIFDRVRENLRINRRGSLVEVMNQSLNQTLSRTVLTSGTTLIAMGCLFSFGGDVLRGFAFIICIGVVIGTYSSIYIACPFALLWEHWFGREARSQRRAA